MLFGKKYRLTYLASVTSLITVANLIFGPLFFTFESKVIPKAKAASITWVGGSTGNWETAANWSSNAVPTASDDVTISSSTGNIVVTLSSGQTANFASLTLGGDSTYYVTTTFIGNIGTAVSTTIALHGAFVQSNSSTQALSGNLNVQSGGHLTHSINGTSVTSTVNLSVVNFVLNSGGVVSAVGKGYKAGAPSANGNGTGGGVYANNYGGGGGYGGNGGKGNDVDSVGGGVNGTTTTPELDAGSSGAGGLSTVPGGAGGGIVKIVASGVATIQGIVSANGSNGGNGCGGSPSRAGGGGAGGGILIDAVTITGAGTVSAVGGNGGNGGGACSGGSGGGGRVMLRAGTDEFTGTINVAAGTITSHNGTTATVGGVGSSEQTPEAPIGLFSNATNAQTTSTNPTQLTTTTPFFSAIFTDPDVSDTTALARIQVSTSSNFSTITHWDSGASGTAITSCSNNNRCQDIKYGNFGTAPSTTLSLGDDSDENSQTIYYWRIRYFDAVGAAGAFSTTTAYFTLLDKPNAPTSIAASSITASAATLSWSDNSNIDTAYILQVSDDGGASFSTATTTGASATSITSSTLSANTRYIYRVAANNSVGASNYNTSSAFYTLANSAGTPTAAAASASSVTITINTNSNPTSTTYALYNTTTANYLAADGSSTATPVYQTTSTWGSSFAAIGLSPNTSYQFVTVSRNGGNANSATSSASTAVYTLANIPTSLSVQTTGVSGQLQASWNANSNPAGTYYYIEETGNAGTNSGWITDTSYTFTGLTAGQTYTFHVRAKNSSDVATAYTDGVSASLPSSGGGAAPASPAPSPTPPPPLPFGGDTPLDVPIEEFAPTGLIKAISAHNGEIDILKEAGKSSPYTVNTYASVVPVQADDQSLDLNSPFTLYYSFSLDKSPNDSSVSSGGKLFSKAGAYEMRYVPNSSLGMCFTFANGNKVCDRSLERPPFAIIPKKKYDYQITWSGSALEFYDGGTKVDSAEVGTIPTSGNPLAVGGTYTEYKPGKFSSNFFPHVVYDFRIKTEPLLIYTNSPNIKLKIDSSYAPEFALKESSDSPSADFSGVGFHPVVPELNWALQGPDGKKCINARFNSQTKKFKFDTFACVILDRAKPSADFTFDPGTVDAKGVALTKPKIYGISDKDAQVTINKILKKPKPGGGLSFAEKISAVELGVIRLAADTNTINLKANKDGSWSHTFEDGLQSGTYTFTVQTKDLAGNTSGAVTKDVAIGTATAPLPPETPPELPPEIPEEPVEEPKPEIPEEPVEEPKPEIPKPEEPKPELPKEEPKIPAETKEPVAPKPPSDPGTEPVAVAVNEDITIESIPAFAAETVDAAQGVLTSIRDFFAQPIVQKVNVQVAVPAAAVIGLANVATGFQLPQLINFLRYLFGQPAMLARRRKQKTWGVVYNSFSKLPVDLATIRLIEESSGRVLTSQVTDFYGRYFLSAEKGQYRLEVIKPGFAGFSEHLKEAEEDSKFTNLYHGGVFNAPSEQFEINFNIPMDPVVEQKPTAKILRDHLWQKIQYGISFAGLAASIMSFAATPRVLTGSFIALHIGLLAIFYFLGNKKMPPAWGVVRSAADKSPLGRAVVRVFDSAYNKLVNTAVTDRKGRYAILVGPSTYYATYEKDGFVKKQTPLLDYSTEKTKGMGGIINRDELLEKSDLQPELEKNN